MFWRVKPPLRPPPPNPSHARPPAARLFLADFGAVHLGPGRPRAVDCGHCTFAVFKCTRMVGAAAQICIHLGLRVFGAFYWQLGRSGVQAPPHGLDECPQVGGCSRDAVGRPTHAGFCLGGHGRIRLRPCQIRPHHRKRPPLTLGVCQRLD